MLPAGPPISPDAYLRTKGIDPAALATGEPDLYAHIADLAMRIHPASLTQQLLFVLNQVRRRYPLKEISAP